MYKFVASDRRPIDIHRICHEAKAPVVIVWTGVITICLMRWSWLKKFRTEDGVWLGRDLISGQMESSSLWEFVWTPKGYTFAGPVIPSVDGWCMQWQTGDMREKWTAQIRGAFALERKAEVEVTWLRPGDKE